MKLEKYQEEDAAIICSWIKDEKSLYQWSANRIGKFPISDNDLKEDYAVMIKGCKFIPLSAFDDNGNLVGHLYIRYPDKNNNSIVRFGFVIVDPNLRGCGKGKKMLQLAIDYAKNILGASKITLGVFINNDSITIDISNDILDLSEKDFSIALDLLTYNLTTVDNIKYLYINVDGKTLENVPGTNKVINYPLSRKNGVNRNFSATSYKDVNLTTIYYINKNNTGYYYVPVTKMNNDNRDKIKIIVDELTSSHTYETNLMSFLNYNTKLMNYELKDDVLTLNFNEFLFDDTASKSILEEVIYSISLSIRDNYDVKEVIFTVDGNEITKSVIKNIE